MNALSRYLTDVNNRPSAKPVLHDPTKLTPLQVALGILVVGVATGILPGFIWFLMTGEW